MESFTETQLMPLSLPIFRSGKSSIQKVVFTKMSPNETLFLDSTPKIVKEGKYIICVMSFGHHSTLPCLLYL